MQKEHTRSRIWHIVAAIGVIALGLASRRFPVLFPGILGKYPGDALWALMVFLGWAIVFPKSSTPRILFFALATAYFVEFLKLDDAPWIHDFRKTTVGHLVFGSTFSWLNLLAYSAGAILGALGESLVRAGLAPR